MPVVLDQNQQDDKDKDQTNGASTTPGGISVGNSLTSGSSGGTLPTTGGGGQSQNSASTSGQTTPGTSSGSFSNIANYINANKDFNNGNGVGGKINDQFQKQAQDVTNGFNSAQQDFQTKAQAADTPNEQYKNNYNSYIQPLTNVNDPNYNASAYLSDSNNANNISGMLNASYAGPTSIDNASGYQTQAQNLSQVAQQGNTEAGRFGLLRSMFGGAGYTNGQQKLDNLLLQGTPGQAQQLQGLQNQANSLSNNINQGINGAATQAQNYQNLANTIKTNTANDLSGAVNNYGSTDSNYTGNNNGTSVLYNNYLNTNKTRDQNYQNVINSFGSGNLTADQAQQLGMSADNIAQLNGTYNFGVNPNNYVSEGTSNITQQNAASKQAYDNLAALKNILGDKATGDAATTLSAYSDPTQAGTANVGGFNFDQGGYSQAQNQAAQGALHNFDTSAFGSNPNENQYFNGLFGGEGAKGVSDYINYLKSNTAAFNQNGLNPFLSSTPWGQYNYNHQTFDDLARSVLPGSAGTQFNIGGSQLSSSPVGGQTIVTPQQAALQNLAATGMT